MSSISSPEKEYVFLQFVGFCAILLLIGSLSVMRCTAKEPGPADAVSADRQTPSLHAAAGSAEIPGDFTGFFREDMTPEMSVGDAADAWKSAQASGRAYALSYSVVREFYGNQIYGNIFGAKAYRSLQAGNWKPAAAAGAQLDTYMVQTSLVYENNMGAFSESKELAVYNDVSAQAVLYAGAALGSWLYDYPLQSFWITGYRVGHNAEGYYNKKTGKYYLYIEISIYATERWKGAFSRTGLLDQYTGASVYEISSTPGYSTFTAAEKLKAVHDYICSRAVYGFSTVNYSVEIEHTPLAFYENSGRMVCDGYAKLFKILADKLSLPVNVLISGNAYTSVDEYGPHMWNAVSVEGGWYLVDATWDDSDVIVCYDYFLAGSGSAGYTDDLYDTYMSVGGQHAASNHWSQNTLAMTPPTLEVSMYHQDKYKTGVDGTVTECCGLHTYMSAGTEKADRVVSEAVAAAALQEKERQELQEMTAQVTAQSTREEEEKQRETEQSQLKALYQAAKEADEASKNSGSGNSSSSSGVYIRLNVNAGSTVPLKTGQKSKKVKVTGLAAGDAVTKVTSSRKEIVKVSFSGKTLTLKAKAKTGKSKITVKTKKGALLSFTVKVQKGTVKTRKISVSSGTIRLKKGDKKSLKVTLTPVTSAEKITYKVVSGKAVKVSKKGVVTAKKKGKATVRITAGSVRKTVTVIVQ